MGMLSLGAELQDLGRPEEGTGMGRTYGMRSGTDIALALFWLMGL